MQFKQGKIEQIITFRPSKIEFIELDTLQGIDMMKGKDLLQGCKDVRTLMGTIGEDVQSTEVMKDIDNRTLEVRHLICEEAKADIQTQDQEKGLQKDKVIRNQNSDETI